jgi:hypothetical protein
LNVHFHSLTPDGIFELEEEGSARFVPLPPPEDQEVEAILRRVIRRTAKTLAAYDEEFEDDALAPAPGRRGGSAAPGIPTRSPTFAAAMSDVFSSLRGLHGNVDEIRSREDALERAFEFEKAPLGFFEAMREIFPDDDVLASLVAVEKSHVRKVMELMVTGSRFREFGDRFST